MADDYNGVGGSFTINPKNGKVAPTIPLVDEPEINYSAANDTLTGESDNGTTDA
jgi:hypothetical protein